MSNKFITYPESLHKKIGFERIREETIRRSYTPYGREELLNLHPLSSVESVKNRLSLTGEWLNILESGDPHPLTTVHDLRPMLKETQAEGSMLPLEHFPVILENARLSRIIKSYFKRLAESHPNLQQIIDQLIPLKDLEEAIQKVVTDQGELKDNASRELKRIRGKLNRERSRLRSTIQLVMKKASKDGMTSDEGPTIRNGRMVIPIQAEFKRKVEGFVHDVSSTGQTIYLEPVQALQINNDIRQLEAEEQREIERIIRKLTSTVRKNRSELIHNTQQIAQLDTIHSITKLGLDLEGIIPQIDPDLYLNLIQARNPILILKNKGLKEPEPVVPLNLELTNNELALVITGPNAGGKSVAMKTAGLLSIMVQCGYPVPVQPDTTLPVLNGLYVDVGDDQSIENDLSTFSSRLHWMRHTLDKIREHSLVLIDEAGAGTDPEEGGALFQAFVEEVIKAGARVIVTTHHGSLKVFAHEHNNVVNGAMEFDQDTLSPTYRFKKGIPGSSYAFEIADRMKLPNSVMERARNLLGEQGDKMGDLLVNLEKKMQESEEINLEYKKRLREVKKREKVYRDKASNFENKRKKILEKAYKDAEEIMTTANRRIEEAVEKIVSQGREDREQIKEARKDVQEAKKEIKTGRQKFEEQDEKPERRKEKPEVGDYVLVGDNDTPGELVDISGKTATVLINGMKVKSKLKKLTKTNPPGKKRKKNIMRSYGGSGNIDLTVKPKLDIRGRRGDEAVKELTQYIDRAITRGLNRVEIIHGKGEGILQKLVHQELEKRKEVKSFDIAPFEHGGSGCTIVEL